MLYPIVGYVTRDGSGTSWAHITYIDQKGDLQDLVRRKGSSTWSYGTNITATTNAVINAANAMGVGASNIPTAKGSLGVSVIPISPSAGSTGQILVYYGTDNAIHAIFPVAQGFYWAGTPGAPDAGNDPPDTPDTGPDEPGENENEGFPGDIDAGDGGDPGVAPSPSSWADTVIVSFSEFAPVTVYTNNSNPFYPVTTVVFPEGGLMTVRTTGPYPWGMPVNISELAEMGDYIPDASGIYWSINGSEHIFGVSGNYVDELWAQPASDQTSWGAHDVLKRVTVRAPLPPGSDTSGPIAPNALRGSPVAAFANSAENFAYINADGYRVQLCSRDQGGSWSIADVTVAAIAPAPRNEPGLLDYPVSKPATLLGWSSDRTHVVYTTENLIVDIWSGPNGSWYWGVPNTVPTTPGAHEGYGVNLATGMSSFVWEDEGVDVLVYVNQNGGISALSLKHGSSAPTSGLSAGLPWELANVSDQVKSASGYVPPTKA